jgi:DNA-binding LytR/AlgR family response regulator
VSTIRAIVCEDEAPQRHAMTALLHEVWPELEVVAECEDGLESIEALKTHRPQIAFLDIRLPGVSGLVAATHAGRETQVVFTTAYSEHAVQAFEQGAIDYLLKPIARDRLRVAVERVRHRLERGDSNRDLQQQFSVLHDRGFGKPAQPFHWISATVGTTTRMIPLDEVLFFQASDKYTRVASTRGDAIIRTPLKELLGSLDPDAFWQVHRSTIVRVASVRAMHHVGGEKYELELAGTSERLPVSIAFKERFRGM